MNRIKSILFVTYHFPPEVGGIQTRISEYVKQLGILGINVTVLFFSARVMRAKKQSFNGAKVVSLSGGMRHLIRSAAHLVNAVLVGRVDVIHVFTGASTFEGAMALSLGRMLRLPSTFSLFGEEDLDLTPFSRRLFHFSATLATSITTNSAATRSLLPHRFQSKAKVLLGGSNISDCSSSEVREKQILFVGRLVKRKGVDDLIDAFSLVRKSVPDAELVIVGEGSERNELYQKSLALGLDVEFKGPLFGKELCKEYERSGVCVLPSKHVENDPASEGLGLTLIEASMHGKPIIGTLHGGIPEIVLDGVNGFAVPEADPERLAEAIVTLLSDQKLRVEMGSKAREIAMSKFTWEAATNRLLDSYSG